MAKINIFLLKPKKIELFSCKKTLLKFCQKFVLIKFTNVLYICKMAHIYIHIPFCRQACYYCNFHFLVSKKYQPSFVEALKSEINLTSSYLSSEDKIPDIKTIYFGGGTPSFLSSEYIGEILNHLETKHVISKDAEITLEANPDDINSLKLKELKALGVNRLSIGIQSFNDKDLKYLNRSHDSARGAGSIKLAQDIGFENINIDLIFGIPTASNDIWERNLEIFAKLKIPHLSAYSLTIEEKTPLDIFIKRNKATNVDENKSAEQFEILMQFMKGLDFEHYEISNYCMTGEYSRHNIAYWQNKPYLGLGPGAHSFNTESRQWNVCNTTAYIKSLKEKVIPCNKEVLNIKDRYNETVFTGLRSKWGIDLIQIELNFGKDLAVYFEKRIKKSIKNKFVLQDGNKYFLTTKGKLFADAIASDCFFVD